MLPSSYYSLFIWNTLYLEHLLISNKYFGPLPVFLSLSRTFPLLHNKIKQKRSISEIRMLQLIQIGMKNIQRSQSKITKQDLIQTVIRMSAVKRKLNNVSLIQKCKIIRHIEKGMTNKAASFFAIFSLSRTFFISNKFSGPLRVRDRESPLYTYLICLHIFRSSLFRILLTIPSQYKFFLLYRG